MPIHNIYSKRKLRQESSSLDVFAYEDFPRELRRQVSIIIDDVFKIASQTSSFSIQDFSLSVLKVLDREKGTSYSLSPYAGIELKSILEYGGSDEDVLDISEFALSIMQTYVGKSYAASASRNSEQLIREWNFRMREAGFGYEFINGEIIRIDSQHLHAEAVKPALALLSEEGFEGADEEFREAFAHYRAGDYRATLRSALPAFESTLKTICNRMGWTYASNATVKPLVQVVINNGLIPTWSEMNLTSIANLLESVATPRNKMAGHGQGETPQEVPQYMAQFGLNMTATSIVMLVSAYKEKQAEQGQSS